MTEQIICRHGVWKEKMEPTTCVKCKASMDKVSPPEEISNFALRMGGRS